MLQRQRKIESKGLGFGKWREDKVLNLKQIYSNDTDLSESIKENYSGSLEAVMVQLV